MLINLKVLTIIRSIKLLQAVYDHRLQPKAKRVATNGRKTYIFYRVGVISVWVIVQMVMNFSKKF